MTKLDGDTVNTRGMPRAPHVLGRRQRETHACISHVLSHATRMYRFCADAGLYVLPQHLKRVEWLRVCAQATRLGALVCEHRDDANTLVTELRAPKRIEKHTTEYERVRAASTLTQATKPIVSTAWLDASERANVHVDMGPYCVYPREQTYTYLGSTNDSASSTAEAPYPDLNQGALSSNVSIAQPQWNMPSTEWDATPDELDATPDDSDATPTSSRETSPSVSLPVSWVNTEYAVLRPTPLTSPYNQPLVDELQLLRMHRRLSDDPHSEMAYMRAAAAVKAVPFSLSKLTEAQLCAIKGIGAKVASLIRQFYGQGQIAEAATIRVDTALQTMLRFTELYGVGPRAAERAYNAGCRTLEDLTRSERTTLSATLGRRASLALLPELAVHIPRAECERIADEVRP